MARDRRIVRKAKKGKPIRQVAAVPFRLNGAGNVEVLLITSNTTGRFIVPKGWPMQGRSGKKTAVMEAKEEAGVVGKALKQPLGVYSYWKRLSTRFVNVTVTVYLLPVAEILPEWKESARRRRAWLSPADAATLIDEPELASLVRSIAKTLSSGDAEKAA
jgi:8-oxo-dGTP pyrophosphatase MutT (NUDIX family)